MIETRRVVVGANDAGKRLDVLLNDQIPDISRTVARHLIDSGHVRIGARQPRPSMRVGEGEVIEVEIVSPPGMSAQPEQLPLDIVYVDSDLAVIDKPAGLVVHPAPGHWSGTIANALAGRFPAARSVGSQERPGIVHRLDKDTSGLLVVALSASAQKALQAQIRSHEVQRRYLALVTGDLDEAEAIIDAPIGRDVANRKRMGIGGIAARHATTSYMVMERFPGFTLIEARLQTGRTHQIRVHFAAIGHPIAGDPVYGGKKIRGLERQFLHAYKLSFNSPSTGKRLEFESTLPQDLRDALQFLQGESI